MYQPYPYQNECLDAIEAARRAQRKRALIVMACGLGKTVTMAFDSKKWLERHGGRLLYLCHQNPILYQAQETFLNVLSDKYSYGFYNGEEKDIHRVDCLFGSFGTMVNHMNRFRPDEFDYIIVDESHHTHAETFLPVVEYFTPKFLLGATATPDRLDRRNIRDIYGHEVYYLPLVEALARGLLSPVDYRLLSDEIQVNGKIEVSADTYMSIRHLNKTIFIPKRDEEVVQIVQRYAAEIVNPRIIYFCSSLKHCEHMSELAPDCLPIHSRIPSRERKVRFELFRQGIMSTAMTVDCFNEGVDIPWANILVFLRSTTSPSIFFQQLGRGLRLSEGKDKVLVLDFVANCERIKMVYDLWKSTTDAVERVHDRQTRERIPPMSLNVEGVKFDERIVQILDIFKRLEVPFYGTWQEASESATRLGIKTSDEYAHKYRLDMRLPSTPHQMYVDFPGWDKFLVKDKYPTWQEASAAAQRLGLVGRRAYEEGWQKDCRLPSNPRTYADFPGWATFTPGVRKKPTTKVLYATWQEASLAVANIHVRSHARYKKQREKDPLLPRHPENVYADFPGWDTFLRRKYLTWKEAGLAAVRIGITSKRSYEAQASTDPRLPGKPQSHYVDFPGWDEFLGKEESSLAGVS
jgi:superfamily II DNA or RNA helicase